MSNNKLNKCKACDKDIAKGVKKCVHCGKDQRNFFMRHKILTGFLAIIILIVVASGVGGNDTDELADGGNDKSESVSADKEDSDSDSEEKNEEETENKKEVEAEDEKEEDVPREHKSALKKAETYSETMHMSKAGVYDQLVSEHGEGFPEDAGKYAIDNMEADWEENALKKAETYANEMDMSNDAIYDQLISEHGEKFTEEEAQYAVDNLD